MGMSPENAGNDNANQEQGDGDEDGGARESQDKKS